MQHASRCPCCLKWTLTTGGCLYCLWPNWYGRVYRLQCRPCGDYCKPSM